MNYHGLTTAHEYYLSYGRRAKELKASGKKVIAYMTALGPVEILTAAGVVPLRLKGFPHEAITKADAHMETIVCPFVRNVFDSVLKGKYELDGMVLPHQCDSVDRTNDVWRSTLKLPYWHFLNVPHVTGGPSIEFMGEILRLLIATLEKYTGTKITGNDLALSVNAHNENRRLMRELYALRKMPLLTGVEMTEVLVAAMSLPVDESSSLIKSVINEVKERKELPSRTRLMLIGDQMDNIAFIETIEEGAWLVMDDLSYGSKIYWSDVDVTPDPLQGIAERYLRKVKIPTTFLQADAYQETLALRFGHIKEYIKEFAVDGVIILVNKYCDPYGFEVPALKTYLESTGTPTLYLEDEYSNSTLPRLKTRVEAFLEMIG